MLEAVAPPPHHPSFAIPARDEALLHTLASTIVSAINIVDVEHCGALPYVVHVRNDAGNARRIVLFQRPEHLLHRPCAFVCFIGQKQRVLAPALVDEVIAADERIMEGLIGHHDVLGYASLELPDRNWCNLVLFRRAEAIGILHHEASHRYAAQELAPRFYRWIHLYRGNLPGGIMAHAETFAVTNAHQYAFGGEDGDTDC